MFVYRLYDRIEDDSMSNEDRYRRDSSTIHLVHEKDENLFGRLHHEMERIECNSMNYYTKRREDQISIEKRMTRHTEMFRGNQ